MPIIECAAVPTLPFREDKLRVFAANACLVVYDSLQNGKRRKSSATFNILSGYFNKLLALLEAADSPIKHCEAGQLDPELLRFDLSQCCQIASAFGQAASVVNHCATFE